MVVTLRCVAFHAVKSSDNCLEKRVSTHESYEGTKCAPNEGRDVLVDERHDKTFDVPLGSLFLDTIDLQSEAVRKQYGLPPPGNIAGKDNILCSIMAGI